MGGTLADQWKEFFYCESMPKEVLVTKGQKRVSGRSSNTKGNDNIISNGSGIAVADGQCMIIVEQGKVVEVCAEPGEFTYDTSSVSQARHILLKEKSKVAAGFVLFKKYSLSPTDSSLRREPKRRATVCC